MSLKSLSLYFLVALLFLTSCATPTVLSTLPQNSELASTTTTETTTTATPTSTKNTTTTTATKLTTVTTTTTTAKPTASTTTKSTTKKTTKKTTKPTTAPNNASNTDNNLIPGKDKSYLLLEIAGAEVKLEFSSAEYDSKQTDVLLWHYSGLDGTVTCTVAAEQNRICNMSTGNVDYVTMSEKNAKNALANFLKANCIPYDADTLIFHQVSGKGSADSGYKSFSYYTFAMHLENGGGCIRGTIGSKNGKLFVSSFSAYTKGNYGHTIPYILSDDIPLLIPRWKSE